MNSFFHYLKSLEKACAYNSFFVCIDILYVHEHCSSHFSRNNQIRFVSYTISYSITHFPMEIVTPLSQSVSLQYDSQTDVRHGPDMDYTFVFMSIILAYVPSSGSIVGNSEGK